MRRLIKTLMLLMGLFILGSASLYSYNLYSAASAFSKNKFAGDDEYSPPAWEGKERVNILLLGGDSRGQKEEDQTNQRSDSMMIASIDPVTKKASLLSVLRDTYVDIPGKNRQDRINAAFAAGGPKLAMKTVSELLNIPIQYYIYTDFKGFINVVDSIGGIDLDVEKDMDYTDSGDGHEFDIHLKKGMQHMDGKTALQYVRFRHVAQSDFARSERQRKFLTEIAKKMQTTSSLKKLPDIVRDIEPYIDTNLNIMDMIKLATLGFQVQTSDLPTTQIPPNELLVEKRINGAQVLTTDKIKLRKYVRDFMNGTADSGSSSKDAGSSSGNTNKTGTGGNKSNTKK
ncbi:LCP family protein [Paenibacillus larvae]|uniref:LCP family protein n=1 Tax=Paenibacillus larvae TaxID=1464 RepID=A0AAP5JU03_9BACL|nr:LCP family protein [Paenibacillus larvae]AVF20530.1 transcriptional regulator LytR [Paenibacillus larvae subsp. larvae]ETK28513.1 transcriptional regulator LytR [Paenibacillus larvae subsp. larvae DSM 25719]MCY7478187.1 LCP family protein [Paenibacillus larvae]MCY7491036.1 LCP family protein [Paenibacillus larvae]MCY9565350.1 LCP family protein [Paenibacillus larvae]